MEKTYNMIKEKLNGNICDLLKKPNMSLEDLKFLGESVDVLKDISIIEGMEEYSEEMENGYSETSMARGNTSRADRKRSMAAMYSQGYSDGVSDARGRSPETGRYVSRDNMGNRSMGASYERGYADGMNDASGKRYYVDTNMSMANQRSGHSIDDRIIACMEKMYDEAGSEYERKRIDDVIAHIHNTGM